MNRVLLLTSFLVQTKRFDLSSINTNRGRDHGLPCKFNKKKISLNMIFIFSL